MAKVFITGSADGLGQLAARSLVEQGHEVVLHARNAARGLQAQQAVPGAAGVVVGDLGDIEQIKHVAEQANALGRFDAVIHNAGVYQTAPQTIWVVNVLAPYILTAAMHRPDRLIYLSSGMHQGGRAALGSNPTGISYSDSKLYVVMLCFAVARLWADVYANAVDPGWVPTKMGGRGAPDDLDQGYQTQTWLATSDDAQAHTTGRYFHHRREQRPNPQASDEKLQARLLALCAEQTGVAFPQTS